MGELVVRGASRWIGERWAPTDLLAVDGVVVDPETDLTDPVVVDGTGLLMSPGFIDLQCNGGLGIDLTSEPERMWELAAGLPRWGVTAWLPTIVTSPPEIASRALRALNEGPPTGWSGAVPLGLHLEGPFLAPARKGAHAERLLQPPSLAAVEGWSRQAGVALVTLAPELDGAVEVIGALVERGVVVSMGHSDATAEDAQAGIETGARWVTHLFNAMAPLHHRAPGLAGIALSDERVHAGLIADGIHVHPAVVALAQRALGERLTLVTDAVSALGMPAGQQRLGRQVVTVGDEGVRLPDGTLAGSVLSMDQAVRNLGAFTGCPPEVALRAASTAPARVLGDRTRGALANGARADVVLLTEAMEVVVTVIGGELVHDRR
jgi:N-acetylglucosamine-6-phosphate deacetylase